MLIIVVLLSAGSSVSALFNQPELSAVGQKGLSLQRQSLIPSPGRDAIPAAALKVFGSVEEGLNAGTVEPFSVHFSARVFVQLRGAEGEYHSATQAYYVLTSFLKTRKPVSVILSTYGATDGAPYATGAATFAVKGTREDLQLYIALHLSGERWVISHLNIY